MSSYHGWTHAPKEEGGTDPIPGGRGGIDSAVYMEFEAKTISDATMTNLTGGTVGQEVVKGDAMTVDNTTGRVTFLEDGIYIAYLNVQWEDASTAVKMSQINWTVNGDQVIAYTQAIEDMANPNPSNALDTVSCESVRFVNITEGNNYVNGVVWQDSAGSKVLDAADFTVVQLAAIAFP